MWLNLVPCSTLATMNQKPTLPPEFWSRLEDSPYKHGFYNLLRWIDARTSTPHPLGRSSSPKHESVRLKQEPSLAFATSTISKASRPVGRVPEVSFLHFGLFGPNGPLPLHLTELARERLIHHRDPTLSAFADIFHHRLLSLFYRAWANVQISVSLDSPNEDFSRFIGSLMHFGDESLKNRDSVSDHAKLHFAGHFLRETRNPEGLSNILSKFFNIPVQVQEFVVHWLNIDPMHQSQLGGDQRLGQTTLLGRAVRDAHSKFRLVLGPLTHEQYQGLLPGTKKSQQLLDWVHQYTGVELSWDAILYLKQEEVPGIQLGQAIPLGLSSWLGKRSVKQGDAHDLIIDYEQRFQLLKTKQNRTQENMPEQEYDEFDDLLIT